MSSVETARKIATKDSSPRQAFLIGSATNVKPLLRDDQSKIARALAVPLEKVSSSALFSNRCFLNNVGLLFNCKEWSGGCSKDRNIAIIKLWR